MRIAGAEHIPASGPVILAANHESMFDPFFLGARHPASRPLHGQGRALAVPVVARVIDSFGAFPVERGTGDSTAISVAASLLAQGEVLGIFPQGTSQPRPSRPYQRGAARLALATGAPLVPIRMTGTRGVPRPGRPPVEILVEEPIAVQAASRRSPLPRS